MKLAKCLTQLQTKLLRFLQDGTFRKVGDENEVKVSVRIIAATQKDLPAMVQEGVFREDLYYRINVLTLEIAPLREREADVRTTYRALYSKICTTKWSCSSAFDHQSA